MALPNSDSRTLNTLISNTVDTYSGDPVNLVNEGGEKLLGKLARAGRIFKVNDAERVEHPLMYGTDGTTWVRTTGDTYSDTQDLAGQAQNEVLTKALFAIKTVTKNLNIPQSVIDRPAQLSMTDVQMLTKRAMMEIFQEEEMWLALGVGATGGQEAEINPWSADTDYDAANGSMSLLGLLSTGVNNDADIFAGIKSDADGSTSWAPQLFNTASPSVADLDDFLGEIQNAVLQCGRFGGIERPTDIVAPIDWYNKFIEALREKHRITGDVVKDMGTVDEIPFAGVMVDWHAHLVKDALWDITDESNPEAPVCILNLNSLRLNLVHGGGVDSSGGFVRKLSPLAPRYDYSMWFSRLEYKYCFSVDNGRRSMGHIEGYTFTA